MSTLKPVIPRVDPRVKSIIDKIKAGRPGGASLKHGTTIEMLMAGGGGRSITTEIPHNAPLRTIVATADHDVIDASNFTTPEQLDRALYEARRAKRIGARLEAEKNALAAAMMLELTGPKEVDESRSPFDCLYENWTMASWPTPPTP